MRAESSTFQFMFEQCVGDGFPDAFDGEFVSVCGLARATELNGVIGRVIGYVERTGRLRVQLRDGSVKALMPHSLRFPAYCIKCQTEVTDNWCSGCLLPCDNATWDQFIARDVASTELSEEQVLSELFCS